MSERANSSPAFFFLLVMTKEGESGEKMEWYDGHSPKIRMGIENQACYLGQD